MNQNHTLLRLIIVLLSFFSISACSTLDQRVSETSNTTYMDVADESYATFQDSIYELKEAFFP